MGSHNSENSRSLNSDDSVSLLGHGFLNNEEIVVINRARFLEDVDLDEVFVNPIRPVSNALLARDGGSTRSDHGPSNNIVSSKESSDGIAIEDDSLQQPESLSIASHVVVNEDVIGEHNIDTNMPSIGAFGAAGAEQGSKDPNNVGQKIATWSDLVKQSIPNINPSFEDKVAFSNNPDGSLNLIPPREFLVQARQQWDTSCIGHFIGGGFDFKFVREQAMGLWKKRGLLNVFYNTKGYFTFKFDTTEHMKAVLNLNYIQMGGRFLFLKPWMESSKFKRNVFDNFPCWIKLGNIPPSYYCSSSGVSMITKLIGRVMKFDEATSRFLPMKFARVLVELEYNSRRPPYIMVPLLNSKGAEDKFRVEVEYSQLPYSCSICKAFGHSLSRCSDNPDREPPRAKNPNNTVNKNQGRTKSAKTRSSTRTTVENTEVIENDLIDKEGMEDFVANNDMTKIVTGTFFGCDVTIDDDFVLANCGVANLNNEDNLDEFDVDRNVGGSAQKDPEGTQVSPVESLDPPRASDCYQSSGHRRTSNRAVKSPALRTDKAPNAHTTQSHAKSQDPSQDYQVATQDFEEPIETHNPFGPLMSWRRVKYPLLVVNVKERPHLLPYLLFWDSNLPLTLLLIMRTSRLMDITSPWVVSGDFNYIAVIEEMAGGREQWTPDMQQFKDSILQAGLAHLRTIGPLHTWSNKNPNNLVHRRLDRMLCNAAWLHEFSESWVHVKTKGIMDHAPLLLHIPIQLEKIRKPFQFFNFMRDITGFQEEVTRGWAYTCSGDPMSILCRKLKEVKVELKTLNKQHGNLHTNVSIARTNLQEIQEAIDMDPLNSVLCKSR
ncbi:hypothetical protein AgCh_027277 [Apium graveolens]